MHAASVPPLPLPAQPGPTPGMRGWNVLAALSFLGLAVWTLIADLTHPGHLLLQDSLSNLFLGLFLTAGMLVSVIFAGFPKRILIPAVVLITIRYSMGWPLLHWMDLRPACLLVDAGLVGLALAHLGLSMRGRIFTGRPWLRWQHSVAMGGTFLLSSLLSLPLGLVGIAHVIESTSLGYVRISPRGIDLTERVFEKEGRRVHLVGMAHIAEGGFYEALNENLAGPVEGRRLVLMEGVSDRENLLPESFASGKTYRTMAEKLGLAEQTLGFAVQPGDEETEEADAWERWAERGVDFVHADIDVSEFDPEHREQLVTLLSGMENMDLANFFAMPEGLDAAALEELIVEALVGQRNRRLMEVYEAEAADYAEVFIPWGAAHLPDLERRFTALGYRRVEEHRRRGIDFLASLRRIAARS